MTDKQKFKRFLTDTAIGAMFLFGVFLVVVGVVNLVQPVQKAVPVDKPDITYMLCIEVPNGFLPYTHKDACQSREGYLLPINVNCNNESYNFGGNYSEQTITDKMWKGLCK
jgi:hypothetical protein